MKTLTVVCANERHAKNRIFTMAVYTVEDGAVIGIEQPGQRKQDYPPNGWVSTGGFAFPGGGRIVAPNYFDSGPAVICKLCRAKLPRNAEVNAAIVHAENLGRTRLTLSQLVATIEYLRVR